MRRAPIEVAAPVAGRWLAVNSPAGKVPSHVLHAYGQTYAIDLVHEPVDGARPGFGGRPGFRRAEEFPAFGQPVLAPADGVVVRAHGRERDHLRRGSLWVRKGQRVAAGLPFQLARFEVDGAVERGVPGSGRPFTVGVPRDAFEDRP